MNLRALLRGSCLVALTSLLGACSSATGDEATSGQRASNAPHILVLGDSIAFGWNPLLESDPHKVVASNYRSYADVIADDYGYVADNAACPGEASGSFIDAHQKDNGCRDNRAAYRLHFDWASYAGHPVSTQLELVKTYLERSIADGTPPKLVTISLGGNDLLLLQKACDLPGPLKAGCELVRLPFGAHDYEEHLGAILDAISDTGYAGAVAVVTTYAPDYSDHIATLGLNAYNDKLKEAVREAKDAHPDLNVVVADGYGAFKSQADQVGGKTCATGLLIKKPDGTCDIHPTPQGHDALAQAIESAVYESGGSL